MEPGNRLVESIVGVDGGRSEKGPRGDLRRGSQDPDPMAGEYYRRGKQEAAGMLVLYLNRLALARRGTPDEAGLRDAARCLNTGWLYDRPYLRGWRRWIRATRESFAALRAALAMIWHDRGRA
jgi:hypothetical protein